MTNNGDQRMSFKLQVISIVAVFGAIGAGLILGSFAHNNVATAADRDEVGALSKQNQALQGQVDEFTRDALAETRFTEGLAPTILYGRLQGIKVLALSTPSGAASIEGVVRMLSSAGSVVTGAIQLTAKFTDPGSEDELLDLAHNTLPAAAASIPDDADGVAASAEMLSRVLVKRAPTVPETELRAVLDAYADAGYLRGTGPVSTPADVVVLVSGPPASDQAESDQGVVRRITAVLASLARAGKVVVAGSAGANTTSAGDLVGAARADQTLKSAVSTVDNADTSIGRLLVAWAVVDQLAGRATHYGTGPGATLVPENAP